MKPTLQAKCPSTEPTAACLRQAGVKFTPLFRALSQHFPWKVHKRDGLRATSQTWPEGVESEKNRAVKWGHSHTDASLGLSPGPHLFWGAPGTPQVPGLAPGFLPPRTSPGTSYVSPTRHWKVRDKVASLPRCPLVA